MCRSVTFSMWHAYSIFKRLTYASGLHPICFLNKVEKRVDE